MTGRRKLRQRLLAAALLTASLAASLLLTGCLRDAELPQAPEESETAQESEQIQKKQEPEQVQEPEQEPPQDELFEEDSFTVEEIPDEVFERMRGVSYPADCPIPREDLRYVRVKHVDFDGNVQDGELICHALIAQDLAEIFRELYRADYPIAHIRLIDDYGGDDDASMEDNNTSCFNYRTYAHSDQVSKHGLGLAVDLNPLYNPFVTEVDGEDVLEPASAEEYADRTKDFPGKIGWDDLSYELFTDRGFIWGGDWLEEKDYQHFEVCDADVARWIGSWAVREDPEESDEEDPAEPETAEIP